MHGVVVKDLVVRHRGAKDFWQTEPVNFSINPGKGLALIGANGSGKTSILRAVAGILPLTFGTVKLPENTITILDLNLAFHPDFTGWENLRLMNACHGRGDENLEGFEEYLAMFAEILPWLHSPIREYSSGMRMRLGIAWMLFQKFDLLILDELLSVGDMAFQRKCQAAIREHLNRGASLLLATHNLQEASMLCEDAILLTSGRIQTAGKMEMVLQKYLEISEEQGILAKIEPCGNPPSDVCPGLKINSARILDRFFEEAFEVHTHDSLTVEVLVSVETAKLNNPLFRLTVHRNDQIFVAGINNYRLSRMIDLQEGEACICIKIKSLNLLKGRYYFSLSVWPDEYTSLVMGTPYAEYPYFASILVHSDRGDGAGMVSMPCEFYLKTEDGILPFENSDKGIEGASTQTKDSACSVD
ncbi:MAG: ABC transporter ATP-binding protein [Candidatus Cloacimonetes bacterium]|nr:ABC transporter ATP-binding protein [Candidatus Cloacimonadota bacterium]